MDFFDDPSILVQVRVTEVGLVKDLTCPKTLRPHSPTSVHRVLRFRARQLGLAWKWQRQRRGDPGGTLQYQISSIEGRQLKK